jgi:hypothetical protein
VEPLEPNAEKAFGPAATPGNPLRLVLLVICLLVSLAALLEIHGGWFGLHDSGAQPGGGTMASGALFGPGCPGRGAPEATRLASTALTALRQQLEPVVPARLGRVYEQGPIGTSNLWNDAEPPSAPPSGSVPAAYEVRWWALDRDGNPDDVVADVLEFAGPAEAQELLARSASPRCRRDGAARGASFPAGAREVVWLNPDGAWQWDVMFVRGRLLYRVSDVPPGLLYVTGRRQSNREWRRAGATARVLACALPDAGCPPAAIAAADTSLARLPRRAAAGPTPSAAQGRAYARVVNLRALDLPGLLAVGGEGPTDDRGYWESFARCTGALRSGRSLTAIHSPEFASPNGERHELVYSTVAVVPTAALASRYATVIESERARACVARTFGRSLLASAGGGGLHHLGRLTVTRLPTPMPPSYVSALPYRAVALRVSTQALYVARGGRRYRFPLYIQGFLFVHGREIVELTAITAGAAFSSASERFLEGQLVGSAEANEAQL